ncbi:MAG: TolC family protein [Bacteroidia bacterium]|nr:TolC family protein [Bacteroidia bacterium]
MLTKKQQPQLMNNNKKKMNWNTQYINIKNISLLGLILFGLNTVSAQQVLTLNDALKIALENNYAIQVAKNDAELSKNNNRIGAAGMLPVVTGTINQDNQVVDTRQKFLSGAENNRDGAKSDNLNANIELGWTIFDGLKMFATKNKLEELQKIGELKMQSNIEQTFMRVTKAYYDVLLSKQQLKSTEDAVANSEQRLKLTTDKYNAGKSAKTEMLKAQVDLNTDKAALMRQTNNYQNAQTNLNQLLGRDLNIKFAVEEKIAEPKKYTLDELMNKVSGQNTSLTIAKKNQQISMLNVSEIKAERLPTIQLKGGYNYLRQQSEAGFLQSSQNNGFHYGAGLSINIFNGFDVNKRLQNARLNLKSNELIYKDSLTRLQNQLQQSFNNYVLSTQLITFEKENVKVAQENFDIANEQFKVGVITSIELRDAQLNLLNNQIRLLNAQYDAQINETELLRLTGELVKL